MYLSPSYMPNAAIHSSLNLEKKESLHYLTEISKTRLALTSSLPLTFYWIRSTKTFFNMHVYATQSQKLTSIIASTATSSDQWVLSFHLNWNTFTKYSLKKKDLQNPKILPNKKSDRKIAKDTSFAQPSTKQAQPTWNVYEVFSWTLRGPNDGLLDSKQRNILEHEIKAWVSQAPTFFFKNR